METKEFRIARRHDTNTVIEVLNDSIDNLNLELDKTESSLSSSTAEKDLFKSIAQLGHGSYGRVSLIQKINGPDKGRYYAVKQIRKADIWHR